MRWAYLFLRLRGVQFFHTKIKGCSIHSVHVRPSGKPRGRIVLVHGIGASASTFSLLIQYLMKYQYEVYVVDLPSHGCSEDMSLTGELLLQVFSDWMAQCVVDPVALFGISLGGALSLRYAAANPHMVTKMILVSPGGGFTSIEEFREFCRQLQFRTYNDAWRFMQRVFHRPPLSLLLFAPSYYRAMNRIGVRKLIQSACIEDFECGGPLPETLFLWGQDEKLFPKMHLEEYKKRLPQHVIFEEPAAWPHCPQYEFAGRLADRMDQFLGS